MKVLSEGKFFGRTARKIQTKNFGLSETSYRAQSKLPPHSHKHPYIGFVLSGCYRERYDRSHRVCQSQSLIYHPAGERHEQFFEASPVKLFRVEISDEYLRELARYDISFRYPPVIHNREAAAIVRRLYREFAVNDVVSPLIVEGLIMELIGHLARLATPRDPLPTKPPSWLGQICELIDARFAETLTLGEAARTVDVHPVMVARYLRRYMDETFGEILRRKRIDFACREIVKAELPLAEIALQAGFYDQSHFSKTFKSMAGATPREFQLLHRKS